jgi:hypothetical protein
MASEGGLAQPQLDVQIHLQQVLGKIVQSTREERLLLQQVSATPYTPVYVPPPGGEDCFNPPIEGILLSRLFRELPEEGLPATFIYAILHSVLSTLTILHKHSVFHNGISARKVLIGGPERFIHPSCRRAQDFQIHLLVFPTSTLSSSPITGARSVPDTTVMIKLVHDLTQCHIYFIRRAVNEALRAPVPWGPPYIADLANGLKRMLSSPEPLETVEEMWGDYMKALLGKTAEVDEDRLKEIWHVAAYSAMERMPRSFVKLMSFSSRVRDMLGAPIRDTFVLDYDEWCMKGAGTTA